MRLSLNILANYIQLPSERSEALEQIFEDLGLEIKRVERHPDDTVFSLELLANRGDLRSYTGIAQELHGRTEWPLRLVEVMPSQPLGVPHLTFKIDSPVCMAYSLSYFESSAARTQVPEQVAQLLGVDGTALINQPVDIGNFVGIESGQPVHVYDFDKIEGQLHIRESLEGEVAHLLFQEAPQQLPAGTLVIADDKSILAIAGVIGCEAAKVTHTSTRILLESALFEPVAIRKTSKKLGLQTTASLRFERGGDAKRVLPGALRAAFLLQQCDWIYGGTLQNTQSPGEMEPMRLSVSELNQFIGSSLSTEQVTKALKGFGFRVDEVVQDTLLVAVPSHRVWDIAEACDLYEEVCRALSYDTLPRQFPSLQLSEINTHTTEIDQRGQLEGVLVESGFFEVFTEGFYSEERVRKLNALPGFSNHRHIRVLGGKDSAAAMMKNTNVAHALELIKVNEDIRNLDVKAFEWSRTFQPGFSTEDMGGIVPPIESKNLWLVAGGDAQGKTVMDPARAVDPLYMKGLVSRLLSVLNLEFEFEQTSTAGERDYPITSTLLHPGRKANILVNGEVVGIFGELHPRLVDSFGIKRSSPCFAELSERIFTLSPGAHSYVQPSRIQLPYRDICFFMPRGLQSVSIIQEIEVSSPAVQEVAVLDVYKLPSPDVGSAVTFRISFDPTSMGETSISVDVLAQQLNAISQRVIAVFKEKGVYQR